MKNVIKFFALIVALSLASCHQKTFTINGSFDESLEMNGQTVTLYVDMNDTVMPFDCIVEDNSFSFKQSNQKDQITALVLGDFGTFAVCLEEGDINIQVVAETDSLSEGVAHIICSGTPNNDLLNSFNQLENQTYKELANVETQEQYDSIVNAYYASAYQMTKENINTIAGRYFFPQVYSGCTAEQVLELKSLMNEETLEDEEIAKILKDFEKTQLTSEGCEYIDFKTVNTEGLEVNLHCLVGVTDYVLVDFWATWCGPCRRLLPNLKTIYDEYGNTGKLQIMSVSVDKDMDAWKNFVAEHPEYNWIMTHEVEDEEIESASSMYGVSFIPTTILINKDGVIVGRNLSEDEIVSTILDAK